jgi:hypothetical protein
VSRLVPRRRFLVSFEVNGTAKDVKFFRLPTEEWVERMIAGTGSILAIEQLGVRELKEGVVAPHRGERT